MIVYKGCGENLNRSIQGQKQSYFISPRQIQDSSNLEKDITQTGHGLAHSSKGRKTK